MDWQNKFITEHLSFEENELKFLMDLGIKLNVSQLKTQCFHLKQTIIGLQKIISVVDKIDDKTELKQETQNKLK